MKTAGIIVAVLVLAVAAVLIYAAFKPDTLNVQRSASIKAPPDKIFALISDFDQWAAWSPYEKKDPAMKRTRSGASKGKGAVYAWEGNKDVGKGRMEIADAQPPAKVTINLDFEKPFAGHNTVVFTIEPKGDLTNVTWAMSGRCAYIAKVIGIFVSMDKMIGDDFAAGLASMKAVAEK
jgi:carbon monoxide dehydrogenase subunit G